MVRGGTALLLGPALDHIPDDHRFDRLELHLWPPFPAKCRLYDDDGATRAYQRGACSVTRYSAEGDDRRLSITVTAAEGGFSDHSAGRELQVVLHAMPIPALVAMPDGRPLMGWSPARPSEISLACPVDQETRLIIQF